MQNFSFRNKELSLKKELRASLMSIYGVGFTKASMCATKIGFAYPFKSSQINSYYFAILSGLLNHIILSEVKSKRNIQLHIKTLSDINAYKGRRHILFLPTRGQRSRTNGRTLKRLKYSKKQYSK